MKTTTVTKPQSLQEQMDRLGPWTTRFHVDGQVCGGGYEVSQDDALLRSFRERLPLPGRVLELGCMEGGRTFPLARRCGQVLAIDVRREHLERARFMQRQLGLSNVTFFEADLETCDLQTLGQFDAVYNVGLLYHVGDPFRVLQQCAAIAPEMLLWTYVVDDGDAELNGYEGRFTRENPADQIGGVRSRSFRPTRCELMRMLTDTGWRNVELVREENTAVALWCRKDAGDEPTRMPTGTMSLAVIITCHNYGRYLDECIRSVLHQSRRPDEIVIVDDASDDDTAEIAERWQPAGVRYLRVDHHNVRLSRQAGLEATRSQVVCFLDADDFLSPDYLRSGMQCFDRYDVGIVYSDMDRFGRENVTSDMPVDVALAEMTKRNVIHCASLVRREALDLSQAFSIPADPKTEHEDWLLWLVVLRQGWKAKKQPAVYHYRRHEEGRSLAKAWAGNTYFERRGLRHETITLFIPLSGRTAVWPRFRQFLEQQAWPHDQVRLVLMDTSQDARFGRRVRRWIAECDYRDVRYFTESVAEPGLADQDRRAESVGDKVRLAAARIYNRLAREATGGFVWVIEDDIIPPNNAAELLLRGFDEHTATVAGPYRSRFHDGYVAWRGNRDIIRERGEGVETIEGNGFGCTLFRTDVLREALFTCRQPPHVDFDPAFYERLKTTNLKVKLCWDAECEHLENDTRPIMTWDHWPESWETADLSEYRAGFLTGREACQWIVDTLNGPKPAAIWGLSDGDVAWWCYDSLAKLPDVDRHWLDKLAATSGLHLEDRDELWPLFDEACRNAPAWLCQSNWDIAERFTHAALTAYGVGIERDGFRYADGLKRKIDCNAVYRLMDHGLWWPLLDGKRLAIVSGHADKFAARLVDPEFVEATGGGEATWSVATKITCPDKTVAKREFWPRVRDELFAAEWDLLLCSSGSLSAVICEGARQRGRRAIDVGAADAAINRQDVSLDSIAG